MEKRESVALGIGILLGFAASNMESHNKGKKFWFFKSQKHKEPVKVKSTKNQYDD